MIGETVQSANASCFGALAVPSCEELGNREKGVRCDRVKCDAKYGVIVTTDGRSENRRMQRLTRPGDTSTCLEDPAGRQLQSELNRGAGGNSFSGADPKSAHADFSAPCEGHGGLSVFRRQVEPRMQRDPRTVS